ncbi:MAG: hypothetical protein OEY94_01560 [Alphaproteobacteria bacterium]|nr:hypothetical protein [Alphaproteobacteria bacterium]
MIKDNRYFWSHVKMHNVTVSVKPRKSTQGVVFRVVNMIDIGDGRQTVVLGALNGVENRVAEGSDFPAVPFRMGSLDFVYTSRRVPSLCDYRHLITSTYPEARIEEIVPEVLAPGDLLVFRQKRGENSIKLAGAMRVVCQNNQYGRKQAGYAL